MFSNSKVSTSTPFAKVAHGALVVVAGGDFDIGELAGRRILVGAEGVDAIPHAPRGDGKHAPELSAAHDPDGAAG